MSLHKKYEEYYGVSLDNDIEVHHIVPKHEGGTDDIGNLVPVTKEEHARLHLERYEETGNFRDLCAYHMIGYNFTKAHQISSSEGGKIGGKRVYANGNGIFRSDEERREWAAMGGKIGGKKQAELGIGFHLYKTNPKLHKEWASKGGINSGNFKNKSFQSEMGKRGGSKNKGFVWINDGVKSFKYTARQQKDIPLDDFLLNNPGIKKGRL